MKIALLGKKGGTGKSSVCLLLHEALRQTGQTVAVRDYDAQGTATNALQRFGGTRATVAVDLDDSPSRIVSEFSLVIPHAGLAHLCRPAITVTLRLVSQDHRFGALLERKSAVVWRYGPRQRQN